MPARNQTAPNSLAGRIIGWLAEHPGAHSAAAIADGIGATNRDDGSGGKYQPVTSECSRMVRRGALVGYRPPDAPRRGPGTVYSLPPT